VDDAAKQHKAIAEFLHADPRKACAEVNSLHSRTGFLDGTPPGPAVTLVFTATAKGKLSASLIEKELKRRKVAVHRLPVRGVDAPARDFTPEFAARSVCRSITCTRRSMWRSNCHDAALKAFP
jgi:CRISPR/Cas system-associated protein Csm6